MATIKDKLGYYEIISGHHRVRAGRAAGLEWFYVLVDGDEELSRSKIVSKQLSHNQTKHLVLILLIDNWLVVLIFCLCLLHRNSLVEFHCIKNNNRLWNRPNYNPTHAQVWVIPLKISSFFLL